MQSDSCFEQNSQMRRAPACCHGNKHVRQNGIQFNALRELLMLCTSLAQPARWIGTRARARLAVHMNGYLWESVVYFY